MGETSDDRLSRLPRFPQLLERDPAVPLRQPRTVVPQKQRNMREHGRSGTKRMVEKKLARR